MTTEFREISQISSRAKYLYTVTNTRAWGPNANVKVSSIITLSQFTSNFTEFGSAIAANNELRDMGKQIVLVHSSGKHYGVLRLVQMVNGPFTEGVPDNWNTYNSNGSFYIFTWSSDPASYNVTVARTG